MALTETQQLRAAVSTTPGSVSAAQTATPRATLNVALASGFSIGEQAGATTLLFEYRGDRGRDWDRGPYRPGPHRPAPYYPGPYYPRPLPLPYPFPSPIPGPLPGERRCSFFEEGRIGSRQDVFGQWWCRW